MEPQIDTVTMLFLVVLVMSIATGIDACLSQSYQPPSIDDDNDDD